jgi:hypothetical protein
MKLGRVTATGPDGPDTRLVGVLPDEGVVVDLAVAERLRLTRAGADPVAARRIAAALFPPSMAAAIGGGPAFTDAAGRALAEPPDEAVSKLDAVTWATPIDRWWCGTARRSSATCSTPTPAARSRCPRSSTAPPSTTR